MSVSTNADCLRIGRVSEVGRIYLLTAVVHQREPVFSDWRLGRLVVEQFRFAQEKGWAELPPGCVRARSARKLVPALEADILRQALSSTGWSKR